MFKKQSTPFDSIRQIDENGNEFWSARALSKVLGYGRYDKFLPVIQKAKIACLNSDQQIDDHMSHMGHMVTIGDGGKRNLDDIALSRYGCYLVVQNADPSKAIVALGQTYFAVQTRKHELDEQFANLPEEQKRLLLRGEISELNAQLAKVAKRAGVSEPRDFGIFYDHGYMGLYGGEKASDIHKRKGLGNNQQILDYMSSDELVANAFRTSQTRQKIQKEQITDKDAANRAHYEVGQGIRQSIEDFGGVLPENMPTPTYSIHQLQDREERRRKQGNQLSMFDEPES